MRDRCAIGGWFERFTANGRADLWLWHAPDWFWMRDHGFWPNGMRRSGHAAPLVATLCMLFRRWFLWNEICWWGYADDDHGYPRLREEPLTIARVIRKDGLLSHGVQAHSPDWLVQLEWFLRDWKACAICWRLHRAAHKAMRGAEDDK